VESFCTAITPSLACSLLATIRLSSFILTNGQMNDTSYTDQYFPSGSVLTEAACKTLIKQRVYLVNMDWKQLGAAGILNLRVLVFNCL
jgi:hypothetical protein